MDRTFTITELLATVYDQLHSMVIFPFARTLEMLWLPLCCCLFSSQFQPTCIVYVCSLNGWNGIIMSPLQGNLLCWKSLPFHNQIIILLLKESNHKWSLYGMIWSIFGSDERHRQLLHNGIIWFTFSFQCHKFLMSYLMIFP